MLPRLNVVYSRVIREEKNMTTTCSKEQRSDILGFSVKTNMLNETPPTIVNPFHQGQEILLVHAHTMVEKVMTLHNTFYFMGTQNGITSNKVKTIIINEVDVEEGLVETGAMDVGANSAHATQIKFLLCSHYFKINRAIYHRNDCQVKLHILMLLLIHVSHTT